jgi:hypothetical protein
MYKATSLELLDDDRLAKIAADPNCSNSKECRELLAQRQAEPAKRTEEERIRRENVRAELEKNPFDPRNEVSADARHIAGHIVKHLWIIFVALPFVLAVLFGILKNG